MSLQKRANGIPLITIEYHSASFSTIGPSNDISLGLGGTLNGNLNENSVPLNGTKNPKYYHSKYHSKNHSDTIQILLAITPPRTIQVPFKYHSMVSMVFELYFFVRGVSYGNDVAIASDINRRNFDINYDRLIAYINVSCHTLRFLL